MLILAPCGELFFAAAVSFVAEEAISYLVLTINNVFIMILGNSKFWVGLMVGSLAGAVIYRCATSKKAKEICGAICASMHNGQCCMLDDAREKAADAAVKIADAVADKAMEAKEKVHAYTGK